MLGRMVRFDLGFAGEAEDILMTALTMRVQRTHRREHRSTRRTREDIVAKILHKRLPKRSRWIPAPGRRNLNRRARLRE